MEITTMTFVTLSILLVAMVCGICTLLNALYDHDHPNEKRTLHRTKAVKFCPGRHGHTGALIRKIKKILDN